MKLAVTWEMCGYIDIPEAKTIEEALDIFAKTSDDIPLPSEGTYVDASFEPSSWDPEEQAAMCGGESNDGT